MNYKTIALATLIGTAVSTVSGAITFGLILNPFEATHTILYEGLMKDPEIYGLAIIAQIPFALLFIYLFSNWRSEKSASMGFIAGAIIGALIGLCFALMTLAQMNLIDWVVVVTDVVGHAVWGGFTGGSIAWVLGRKK